MSIRKLNFALALGAIATAAACAQPVTPASPSGVDTSATSVVRQAEVGFFEVCKDYVGSTGPSVTINVTVDVGNNGSVDQTFTRTLAPGTCQDVWADTTAGADLVTVTETVPTNFVASFIATTILAQTATTGSSTASNTFSGLVNPPPSDAARGVLVVFTNTFVPPPPPPGDEGCTPGYWKQEQHFDSWTAPFTPTTQFSAVFENAFPGMTLDQVLGQGGGGLNALGRHTVAALLNAASAGVEYPLTVAQVIAGFNAVFPGGDYETLKNRWAAFNELGCPLN
jgi:hypothetical protein